MIIASVLQVDSSFLYLASLFLSLVLCSKIAVFIIVDFVI
jgi:hypothetical protein